MLKVLDSVNISGKTAIVDLILKNILSYLDL